MAAGVFGYASVGSIPLRLLSKTWDHALPVGQLTGSTMRGIINRATATGQQRSNKRIIGGAVHRHIIIEGMDGSGKDTLINRLSQLMPGHTLHKRASTSLGGPVADLAVWTATDVRTMADQPPSLYNRHPLVSEPIYAHIREVNGGLRPPWTNAVWVKTYQRLAADQALLVICQPPWAEVRKNLLRSGPDAHMPGVYSNAKTLYDAYANLLWPGAVVRYNYTTNSPETLVDTMRKVMAW
jgi:hypothetical protein